jgi:nucleoside-diphosphate-sugar epimerase
MDRKILVTGGAGYVGSNLVPKLLKKGYAVVVLDLYIYGKEVFHNVRPNHKLIEVEGDIRDVKVVKKAMHGCDVVIHLACISNDPSYDLNPDLGRSINYDSFRPLIHASKNAGVKRFIYASSSSVYGLKDEDEVTEDLPLEPLTDYSKYKVLCEKILEEEREPGFVTCTIRPSTVCGYAPRQRLDVVVNILTNHAVNNGRIKVFGGSQKRPNIHIEDMSDLYCFLLEQSGERIDGKIYNAGYENYTLIELAEIVKRVIGKDLSIDVEQTDDLRSYHVSSQKMKTELGFEPSHNIESAVRGLLEAFEDGRLPNPMDDSKYFNIKKMQEIELT